MADEITVGALHCEATSFQQVQIADMPRNIVILGADNRTPLVTINPDGSLEYGADYTPDEAARRFWDAMRFLAPARCPNCGHVGLVGASSAQA